MLLGTLEAGGPLWGWDGDDGDDDWEAVVLTLLALAVVATLALALHWFGSREEQETASAAPGVQPAQAGGARQALHPKPKDSEGQSKGQQTPEAPGDVQRRSAAARTQDPGPSIDRSMASDARLLHKTTGEVTTRGATLAALGKKRKEPAKPETFSPGHRKAKDIPVPIMIHFTPRSLDSKIEMQLEASGTYGKGTAGLGPIHTEQQDTTSPWHLPVGPLGPLGRGLGSLRRRRRPGASSGDRPCRPLKLDPLRLGTVVSVWDAEELHSEACTVDQVAGQSKMEKLGEGHLNGKGRGSCQGKESKDVAGRPAAEQSFAL